MSDTYLLGGQVLLPGGALEPADLHLRGGVVAEIGAELKPVPGAQVIEVAGFTVPGLIDAHAHISWAGLAPMPQSLDGVRSRAERNLRLMLRSGVTTVRDVGSIDGVAPAASGGPACFSANQVVCAVGGHGTELAQEWAALPGLAQEASGPGEFRAAVRRQVDRGADLIKVTLNAAELQVSQEEASALVDEAHRVGRRVAAHASVPEAIEIAIEAGADTIEHGNGASPGQLRRMAEAGTVLVPTVWIFQWLLDRARDAPAAEGEAWPPPADVVQTRVDAHRRIVRDAVEHGVTLAAGTDAIQGCEPDSLAAEINALHRLGLGPLDALRAATEGGAAALGKPELGVLVEGGVADLVVFDGEPHEIVADQTRPSVVFQGGRRLV